MNRRLSFLAGVIAGMGQARRRIGVIAFLAGVVTGIGLGIGAGMGMGIGLRKKGREVYAEWQSVNGTGTDTPPPVPPDSREAEPAGDEATP
jgi:hypothetical protein